MPKQLHIWRSGKLQEKGGGIGMSLEVLLLSKALKAHLVCIDVYQYDWMFVSG